MFLVDDSMMGRFQSVLTWICAGVSSAILAHTFATTYGGDCWGSPTRRDSRVASLVWLTVCLRWLMEVPTLVRIFVWITLWNIQSRLTVWRERDITYRTYRDYFRLQTPIEHLQFKCSVRDQESRPDGIVLANSTLCGTCTFTEAKTDGHHWPLGIVAEPVVFYLRRDDGFLPISPDQHKRLNTARMSSVYDYL